MHSEGLAKFFVYYLFFGNIKTFFGHISTLWQFTCPWESIKFCYLHTPVQGGQDLHFQIVF